MSKGQRLLAYSLLSLITSQPLASSALRVGAEEDEADEVDDRKVKGHMNADRAWCWREHCDGA